MCTHVGQDTNDCIITAKKKESALKVTGLSIPYCPGLPHNLLFVI